MKKKIVSVFLVVALLAIGAMGSIAYFTDVDTETNVFTIGEVKIDLYEDFNTDKLTLIPAVGSYDAATGVTEMANTIEKEVYVENIGANKAYVRVHIAVPAFQKDNKNINVLSLVCDDQTTVDGLWNWGTNADSNWPPRDGGDWNIYRDLEINGVPYKVYVVTYETELAKGDVSCDAITKVYMEPTVTQEDIAAWDEAYGEGEWAKIYVAAQAVQADGFDDAFTALEAAFPVLELTAADFTAAGEGESFKEMESLEGTL